MATILSLTIFIHLAVVASQICEFTRDFKKIRTYSSSRSYKVIDHGAIRKLKHNFLLVVNSNLDVPWSRYWRIKLENSLFSRAHPCLTPLLNGEPVIISGWNLSHKNWLDEATVWWKLHYPSFNSFWLIHPCDRRTYDTPIAYSALCIYAVLSRAKKSTGINHSIQSRPHTSHTSACLYTYTVILPVCLYATFWILTELQGAPKSIP